MSGMAVDPKRALSRTFLDEGMVRWEAYVSGGQPNTARAARIYFVCLEDPFEPPRWVPHESRSVAEATRALAGMSDAELLDLRGRGKPLE
ncbi:hypothetical protein [Candidatus Palauibacter sp.]|uniref:hypothetical protein n=1 Tax=Candidatus Palauibacter sp. TaxID=3101350 RepID=UPI003B525B1C